jgi:hypothetical protein
MCKDKYLRYFEDLCFFIALTAFPSALLVATLSFITGTALAAAALHPVAPKTGSSVPHAPRLHAFSTYRPELVSPSGP